MTSPDSHTSQRSAFTSFLRVFHFPPLESMAFGIVTATLFLVLVFIIPSQTVAFEASKSLVIYIGTALALIAYIGSLLQTGKVSFPIHSLFVAALILPVIYFMSALVSPAPVQGLVGDVFETHTFIYLFAAMIFFVLTSLLFRDRNRIFYSYLIFFTAFFVIALFQAAKLLVGGKTLSFDVLTLPTSNMVGTWNDFGIVMGAMALLSLVTLAMLPLNKWFRAALYTAFGISLLFIILVNFSLLWIFLSTFALIFFVYIFSIDKARDAQEKKTPKTSPQSRVSLYVLTLIVLAVGVVFLVSDEIGAITSSVFNTYQQDVYPWQATIDIARGTLSEYPVLGVGPNQFEYQWFKYKPTSFNQTSLWNIEFNSGDGYILTSIVTTGLLGFIAWLSFLILFIWAGIKAMFSRALEGHAQRYLVTSSFLVSLYMWFIVCIYTPNAVVLTLTFFFTGLFFASSIEAGVYKVKTYNIFSHPRISFVSVLASVMIILASLVFIYYVSLSIQASAHFRRGVFAFNETGSISQAEQSIARALRLRERDHYYRTLAQLGHVQLQRLMNNEPAQTDVEKEKAQQRFQAAFGAAIQNAHTATSYNKNDYRNWLVYAQVYHGVMPVEPDAIYPEAVGLYEKAIEHNPTNPALHLVRAQLERENGTLKEARSSIKKALQLKGNYTAARFLLVQIELQENNTTKAIESLQIAMTRDPANPTIPFQLGVLHYNEKEYTKAITVFERALSLTGGSYANARYFLGLSYSFAGERQMAIDHFEILQERNPDNTEVQQVLSNIRRRRNPLSGIAQPSVQKRPSLPVEEDEEDGETVDIDAPVDEGETATTTEE